MKTIPCLIFLLFFFTAKSQSDIATAGGDASGTGGSAAFTIGIVNYITESSTASVVNQGVQQPYIFTGKVYNLKKEKSLLIFPNPTKTQVILQFINQLPNSGKYAIQDILGQVIFSGIINNLTTEIDLSSAKVGIYIISIFSNQELINSTKIIKTN